MQLERDARAFQAVVVNGRSLVPVTVTDPRDVVMIATQRLRELRWRAWCEVHGKANPCR
jgi:hypothetical protein